MSKVENYSKSIEIKKQQVQSLEAAVDAATSLYQIPRVEFADRLPRRANRPE